MIPLPVLGQPPQLSLGLVGGGWRTLDVRQRGATFLALPARSVINAPAATGMNFWSLNPYVGCEFGCTYCYARDTHRYAIERAGATGALSGAALADVRAMPAWEAFERRILVKTDAAALLARSLDPARLAGQTLVIGTATDPYQPAERRFRLTRQVLEALLRYRDLSIGIITKSPLITRDLGVLRQLAERHDVHVNISLATLDPALARRLELRSPVPAARLRALARLRQAGIEAGVLIAPIVPALTDGRAALGALMAAARRADARWAIGSPLRLGPAARNRFLPYLAEEFPELVERYRRRYGQSDSAGREYQRALERRLDALQRIHGFAVTEGRRRRRQIEGEAPTTRSG